MGAQCHQLGQRAPAEEIEEVGPVVGGGCQVELVAGDEIGAVGAKECHGAVVKEWRVQEVVAIGLVPAHAGVIGEVEGAGCGERPQVGDLGRREVAVLDHERGRLPATNEHQTVRGFGHPRGFERRDGSGNELERIARRQLQPAAERKHPAGCQPRQVIAERLAGIAAR